MKKMVLFVILVAAQLFAGTPTIDGSFDGEATWGSPVATADGTVGWAGANAKKLYITEDATYIYFGAEVTASTWQGWAFTINTKSGGGSTESWSRSIDYGYTNKPDYIARGHFGGYAEFHTWNGSSWTGYSGLAGTEFGENITGSDQDGWVEIRIAKTAMDSPSLIDVQFYITGDNNNHGTFDACPDDQNSTSWDQSSSHTVLDTYSENNTTPVELTSFTALVKGKSVELAWQTASEVNNHGFEILRSAQNDKWEKIGFVEGKGTTNNVSKYSFIDNSVVSGTVQYRLKQIDRTGEFSYSNTIEVVAGATPNKTELSHNYPNPFNPSTVISYQLSMNSYVTLKVYDVLGKEVATLVDEFKEAGNYSATFNASQLSSGVYYYKLQSVNFSEMKKMVLMK